MLGWLNMLRIRRQLRRRTRWGDTVEPLDMEGLLRPMGLPSEWHPTLHHLMLGFVEHIGGRTDRAFQLFGRAPDDGRITEQVLSPQSSPEVARLLERHHTVGSVLLALARRARQQGPLFLDRLRWLERSNPAVFALLSSVGRVMVPAALLPVYAHHAAEEAYNEPLMQTPPHALHEFRTTGRVSGLPTISDRSDDLEDDL